MTRPLIKLAVWLALGLVASVAVAVWWETPNLSVEIDRQQAVIHMELLGEYPTDLRTVEVSSGGVAIWKLVAVGELFQVHSIRLRVGSNPGTIKPDWGKSIETVPHADSTFQLQSHHLYRVRICPASPVGLCRSADLTLDYL